MKILPQRAIVTATSAAVLALAAGFAPAQSQQLVQTQPQLEAEVDDATLRAFAQALLDIEEIADKWTPRVQSAENRERAQELREQANDEMKDAVRANGLKLDTYNEVYQLTQAHPDVALQVQRHLQEMR